MTGLAKSATIEFECGIATSCEDKDCEHDRELNAFVVTGNHGRDSIAVYCPECSELREDSDAHTHVGSVVEVVDDG